MKKLLFIILLLPLFVKAQTTYQLNYDSIRVNKTAGTGGTSLYGKVYLKNVSARTPGDSILTVVNGRIFKVPYVAPATGTVTSVAALTLGTSGTDLNSSVANSTTTPVITLNVPTASASNRGVLSAADWSTFNSKQAALSGTGFVKISGTTISYDNATYALSSALSSYLPKTTGGSSNPLNGELWIAPTSGTLRSIVYQSNTGGDLISGISSSTGSGIFSSGGLNYASGVASLGATALQLGTNGLPRISITQAGVVSRSD